MEEKKLEEIEERATQRPEGVDSTLSSKVLEAAGRGDLQHLQQLIDSIPTHLRSEIINHQTPPFNPFPLHVASSQGHLEVVKFLVTHGADLTVKDDQDLTALHLASLRGCTKVVKFLTSRIEDVTLIDAFNSTPLHYAAYGGHLDTVKILTSAGADTSKRY
eukprot:TRINITY_DN1972_c0_g1_i1.p1 TRINITY_DN1972_c0_g1~~TRINITY_DN1972_c0_g1_i1.p1  ORF type:complete len:161 (+),score=34.10 TRINITY_DN1972_c0_g1_i1:214-696(+)